MSNPHYIISVYMNSDFHEEYWLPFLKEVVKDKSIPLITIKQRRKKGGRNTKEIESAAVRGLIEKYVKMRIRNRQSVNVEQSNNSSNEVINEINTN